MPSVTFPSSASQTSTAETGDAVVVGEASLTIDTLVGVSRGRRPVRLTGNADVLDRIEASCAFVEEAVASGRPVYGVTTCFGGMSDVPISAGDASALQMNALRLHKTGAGSLLPLEHVRAAMLLRMNSHVRGASGIRLALIRRIARFLNEGVTPHVREYGSIGASGDLVPLSYIAGALIGLDASFIVDFRGEAIDAVSALERLGLERMELRPKEGLAMINGTAVSTAIAAGCLYDGRSLFAAVLGLHGLAIQALGGTLESFQPFIHAQKPHPGQRWVAHRMVEFLGGSKLMIDEEDGPSEDRDGRLIQDRYSLRCLPQYLGPIVEGLKESARQLQVEMNAATDNPLIDVEHQRSYHGGNFLGQYVGIAMDHLRAYLGLCAKHVDAQIALLVAPAFSNGLPPSLVGNTERPFNMGVKGLQLTANSIMPLLTFLGNSFVDRFPTHAEQYNQNINSQSFAAANLARQSIETMRQYLATNLLICLQAVELRTRIVAGHYDARRCLSPATVPLYEALRQLVGSPPDGVKPYLWNDDEAPFDEHIAVLAEDLATDGRVAGALEEIRSSLTAF